MSFEGYYQVLCGKGHLHTEDCYDFNELTWQCPDCNRPPVWFNLVDVTNGSDCDCNGGCEYCDNGRIDGFVSLEPLAPPRTETCPCCNTAKLLEPGTYKIPQDKGHVIVGNLMSDKT